MRYTATAAIMAGVAAAAWSPDMGSGHGGWGEGAAPPSNGTGWGDSYTTEVVTAFTTYCPEATQITHGGMTYTVSEATTLTVTNCPGGCTITKPVSSAPPATWTSMTTSAVESSPVMPTGYTTSMVSSTSVAPPAPVYPTGNATMPAPSGTAPGYSSATSGSPVSEQTGNSASTLSAGAAGILAVFGLVAAL